MPGSSGLLYLSGYVKNANPSWGRCNIFTYISILTSSVTKGKRRRFYGTIWGEREPGKPGGKKAASGPCKISESTDKHQTTLEMMETLRTLLSEAAHLAGQLPTELFPDDIEQSLVAHLTSLLLTLNEHGVAPDVEKDRITVQGDIKVVQDTISDVLALIVDQGNQKRSRGSASRVKQVSTSSPISPSGRCCPVSGSMISG